MDTDFYVCALLEMWSRVPGGWRVSGQSLLPCCCAKRGVVTKPA